MVDVESRHDRLSFDPDGAVARPSDRVSTINRELALGKQLVLTPGVYDIDQTIKVERADTVVLGLGLATLTARHGSWR